MDKIKPAPRLGLPYPCAGFVDILRRLQSILAKGLGTGHHGPISGLEL